MLYLRGNALLVRVQFSLEHFPRCLRESGPSALINWELSQLLENSHSWTSPNVMTGWLMPRESEMNRNDES